ncbi:MAG: hypothetical protein ABIH71_07280 [Candidatus Omnitrophota bacterium]|nr:hypothetical protein [Candidatus Omnitrophota bacterium]
MYQRLENEERKELSEVSGFLDRDAVLRKIWDNDKDSAYEEEWERR